jgi:hypothetical protein
MTLHVSLAMLAVVAPDGRGPEQKGQGVFWTSRWQLVVKVPDAQEPVVTLVSSRMPAKQVWHTVQGVGTQLPKRLHVSTPVALLQPQCSTAADMSQICPGQSLSDLCRVQWWQHSSLS